MFVRSCYSLNYCKILLIKTEFQYVVRSDSKEELAVLFAGRDSFVPNVDNFDSFFGVHCLMFSRKTRSFQYFHSNRAMLFILLNEKYSTWKLLSIHQWLSSNGNFRPQQKQSHSTSIKTMPRLRSKEWYVHLHFLQLLSASSCSPKFFFCLPQAHSPLEYLYINCS
jgi:hypothetical protein